MPSEADRWAKLNMPGPYPVWSNKAETDASYRLGMEIAIDAIATRRHNPNAADVAVTFATHNELSVDEAIDHLRKSGLGVPDPRGRLVVDHDTANHVAFAQNYGMKDGLTNRIAASVVTPSGRPLVVKVRTCS